MKEMMEQRRWWRNLDQILKDLKVISKQGPAGAALAEQVARDIQSRYDNATAALAFIAPLLGRHNVLAIVAGALGLDPRVQIGTAESLWTAARDEADYLFRGHAFSPPRDDYHPLLRFVWDGRERSSTSLILRFISRMTMARERMAELGWELPATDAAANEFENFFADLCEAAAGPGLRRLA